MEDLNLLIPLVIQRSIDFEEVLMDGLTRAGESFANLREALTILASFSLDPPPGLLDCAAYVKCRLGHEDHQLASHFGRVCAQYSRETGIEPIKMPHCFTVNTWPKDFLNEVWTRNFGSYTT